MCIVPPLGTEQMCTEHNNLYVIGTHSATRVGIFSHIYMCDEHHVQAYAIAGMSYCRWLTGGISI